MKWAILSNPPIREAIIDFKYQYNDINDTFNKIDKFIDLQKGIFIDIKKRTRFGIQIEGNINLDNKDIKTSNELEGYVMNSSDKKRVIILTTNSFSYHIIKPYSNWNSFYSEANEIWGSFFNLFDNLNFNRIALRYINEIDFKFPLDGNLNDSILTMPNLPEKMPKVLNHYFLQMGVSDIQKELKANITQTFKPPEGDKLSFIFDIDVYKNKTYNDEISLWNDINILRDFKNTIFFNSLSKEIIKRYE